MFFYAGNTFEVPRFGDFTSFREISCHNRGARATNLAGKSNCHVLYSHENQFWPQDLLHTRLYCFSVNLGELNAAAIGLRDMTTPSCSR